MDHPRQIRRVRKLALQVHPRMGAFVEHLKTTSNCSTRAIPKRRKEIHILRRLRCWINLAQMFFSSTLLVPDSKSAVLRSFTPEYFACGARGSDGCGISEMFDRLARSDSKLYGKARRFIVNGLKSVRRRGFLVPLRMLNVLLLRFRGPAVSACDRSTPMCYEPRLVIFEYLQSAKTGIYEDDRESE